MGRKGVIVTLHKIALDIRLANNRNCRKFQEKIIDSYDDGRLKFEWDLIRENYYLNKDAILDVICKDCPLNINQTILGCEGEIYNLDLFLNFLKINKPESILLKYTLDNCNLTEWETLDFYKELSGLKEEIADITWPAASVYYKGELVKTNDNDFYLTWDGSENRDFSLGNESYHLGIYKEGIVIKKKFLEPMPQIFKHLWKEGDRVFGETLEEEIIVFELFNGLLPVWDPIDQNRESELIFKPISAGMLFKNILDSLLIFTKTASLYNIGIKINLSL
ncbi:MAG: hypothetical protein HYU63_03180 [Armatimonadetes bacterium]|nr:hypothetical protein [Armatimonadota bacterium]